MSNDAIRLALRQDIPSTPKWVLTVLCNAANDAEGRTCRRSHALLAQETGLNRTTVVYAVKQLVDNGRIEKVGRYSDGSIIYRVLVAEDNQPWVESCRTQPAASQLPRTTSVAVDNQESCRRQPRKLPTTTHNQRNQITKKKKNMQEGSPADPRHQAFIAHIYEQNPSLVISPRGAKALKDLLAATGSRPAYGLDKLAEYWQRFLNSPNKFYREHGDPLFVFCQNINSFTDKANGTRNEHGGSSEASIPERTSRGERNYTPKQ